MQNNCLVAIQTHPIQYWAPIYRHLEQTLHLPTTTIYGSDFSIHNYYDADFKKQIKWDSDLLGGYSQEYVSQKSASKENIPNSFLTFIRLYKLINKINPKAILLTGYWPRFNFIALLVAIYSRRALLLRCEATDQAIQRSPISGLIRRAILKVLYKNIDEFLFIGENSRQHYLSHGVSSEQMHLSPYCVDFPILNPTERLEKRDSIRKELNIPQDRIVIIFSGKLNRKKSPDHLLQASQYLDKSLAKKISIIFLGDGELRNSLETSDYSHNYASVHIIGFVNQTQITSYYAAADAFSINSLFGETWGLVVNEALSSGLPCLASDAVGSHIDLIQQGVTGEVYKKGDIQDLAHKLEKVIELSKLKTTSFQCQQKVSKYSLKNASNGIYDAFQIVTKNSSNKNT